MGRLTGERGGRWSAGASLVVLYPETACDVARTVRSAEVDCPDSYVDLSPHLDKSPIQITEKTPLDRVIEMFRSSALPAYLSSLPLLALWCPSMPSTMRPMAAVRQRGLH